MFRKLFVVCLAAYCVVVAWFTLRSLPFERGSVDWIPFLDTWQLMRDRGDRPALREVASNFVLFVPLGYFLQGALRLRLLTTFALAAAASVGIEAYQAFIATGRNPSIDDVIYNAAGALAGATVFELIRGALRYRRAAGNAGGEKGAAPASES